MKFRLLPKQPQALAVIRQYMVAVSASLTFAGAGSSIAWPSPTLPKLTHSDAPLSLGVAEISWMVSLTHLGSLTSALIAEYLIVKHGPWKILLFSGFMLVASWLFVMTASLVTLYIARFLAGLHFGLVSIAQPIYIADISQADIRSTLSTLNNFMFSAGGFFTFVIGPFVSYHTLAIVSLLLPILFILTFWCLPDSPYYSLEKESMDKARESLFWLRGDINRIELEFELDQMERTVQTNIHKKESYKELFSEKALRKGVVISTVLEIIACVSGIEVFQAYSAYTFPQIALGIFNPSNCMIVIGVVCLFSSILGAFVTQKLNRKPVLIFSFAICCITMLILGIWFSLDSNLKIISFNFVPLLGFLIQSFSNTLGCTVKVSVVNEILPPRVKMKSLVITTVGFAFISFIINKFYLPVKYSLGISIYFIFFSMTCFLLILFTIFCLPETKSKTLQDIQDIFSGIERQKITTPIVNRTF